MGLPKSPHTALSEARFASSISQNGGNDHDEGNSQTATATK